MDEFARMERLYTGKGASLSVDEGMVADFLLSKKFYLAALELHQVSPPRLSAAAAAASRAAGRVPASPPSGVLPHFFSSQLTPAATRATRGVCRLCRSSSRPTMASTMWLRSTSFSTTRITIK